MDALLFLSPTLSPDPPAASYIIVAASAQNGRDVLKGGPLPTQKVRLLSRSSSSSSSSSDVVTPGGKGGGGKCTTTMVSGTARDEDKVGEPTADCGAKGIAD